MSLEMWESVISASLVSKLVLPISFEISRRSKTNLLCSAISQMEKYIYYFVEDEREEIFSFVC